MTLLGDFQYWAGLLKLEGTVWFFTSCYWHKCSKLYLKSKKKGGRGKKRKKRNVDLTDVYLTDSVSHMNRYQPYTGPGWQGQAFWGCLSWWKWAVVGGGNSQIPRQCSPPCPHASRFPCSGGDHRWLVNPRNMYSSDELFCQTILMSASPNHSGVSSHAEETLPLRT